MANPELVTGMLEAARAVVDKFAEVDDPGPEDAHILDPLRPLVEKLRDAAMVKDEIPANALAILEGMTDEQLDVYLRARARRRAAVTSHNVGAPFDPDACFGKELRVYPKAGE